MAKGSTLLLSRIERACCGKNNRKRTDDDGRAQGFDGSEQDRGQSQEHGARDQHLELHNRSSALGAVAKIDGD